MSSSAVLGTFLWHELLTGDPEAGAGFYSDIFGWNVAPWEGHDGYTMLKTAKGPMGGRVVGSDPLADAIGPQWLTYVGVPDLDAALADIEANGGKVVFPTTDVPDGGGRYAVITDPHGAHIGVYEPGGAMAADGAPTGSPVEWHELTSEDPQAALKFYNAVFGWETVATHEMGADVGTYYLFGKGSTQMGGIYKRPDHMPGKFPRWLVYLGVPSVTAVAAAAPDSGGKVLMPPHQVPGGNWVAQFVDSAGVALAIHGPKEAAGKAAPSKPKAPKKAKAATAAKSEPTVEPAAAASTAAAPAKVKTKTASTQTKAKPKVEVKSKAEAKTKAKAKAKAKAKKKSVAKPKAKSAPKAKTKMKAKSVAKKAKKKSAPKPKSKAKSKASGAMGKKDKAKNKKKDKVSKKDRKKARKGK